jgi:hypothetical protein
LNEPTEGKELGYSDEKESTVVGGRVCLCPRLCACVWGGLLLFSLYLCLSLSLYRLNHSLSLSSLSLCLSLSLGVFELNFTHTQMISFSFSSYFSRYGWLYHVVCGSNVFLFLSSLSSHTTGGRGKRIPDIPQRRNNSGFLHVHHREARRSKEEESVQVVNIFELFQSSLCNLS